MRHITLLLLGLLYYNFLKRWYSASKSLPPCLPVSLAVYTDEVKAKSRALEKTRMKLRSAEEDIADLQTEFELERQGYLDTIRNQVLTISDPITEVILTSCRQAFLLC